MAITKIYFCFEAAHIHNNHHAYLLYSTPLSDLMPKGPYIKPTFSLECVIPAGIGMGCGVFGSKIVLAGGYFHVGGIPVHHYGLISYDITTKRLSLDDFPKMSQFKVRPLVIQLHHKLYVLDTSEHVVPNCFESYDPKERLWHKVCSPHLKPASPYFVEAAYSRRTPYSWFSFGKCICLSAPGDINAFIHHTDQFVKRFTPRFDGVLPFLGMATTYYQRGFSDVVVISLSHGRVEARRLNVSSRSLGDPKLLFETDPSQPHGEISNYFADCGEGRFCLTTFDNINLHIYMFKIFRRKDRVDGSLDLDLISINVHRFDFTHFSTGNNTCLSVLGCFAPSIDDCDKQLEESKLYRSYFPILEPR